jgi:LuxR family maltose regulon positive regulatory protein
MERPVNPQNLRTGFGAFPSFRLTLLVAPAGSGKSRLLHRWAEKLRSENIIVVWMGLVIEDNNPERFWSDLLRVFNQAYPVESSGFTADLEHSMTTLINQLSTIPGRLVLIMDNYHTIQNETIHQAVSLLLDYPPAGLALVIASRSQPPLQIPRLRARRQLLELGMDDLITN